MNRRHLILLSVIICVSGWSCSDRNSDRRTGNEAGEGKVPRQDILVFNIANNLNLNTVDIESNNSLTSIIQKAAKHIRDHDLQNKCYTERPWGLFEYEDRWEIWFRRLNDDGSPFSGKSLRKPWRYLIIIDKKTEQIRFQPLK